MAESTGLDGPLDHGADNSDRLEGTILITGFNFYPAVMAARAANITVAVVTVSKNIGAVNGIVEAIYFAFQQKRLSRSILLHVGDQSSARFRQQQRRERRHYRACRRCRVCHGRLLALTVFVADVGTAEHDEDKHRYDHP